MYLITRLFTVSVLVAGPVIPFKSFAATLEECNAALLAGDYARGVEFFQPRAEKGDAMAQFHVGFIHMHMTRDPRVPPDYAEVAKWYRKAAEQGNSCAQNGLGLLYADGHGVPKDPSEAARWYRRAADQGHSMAQYNLGVLYRAGSGVPKDDIEAAKWFQRSADLGNDAGRKALLRLRGTRKE